MTTINYCDYAAGNDSTGDGSAGNPYKTITKASTGLSGGDEVRVAKSPAPTALSGTLTFTDGSTSVATSSDLTGSLAAKDFVGLNTAEETWWEISSINSTTITLVTTYRGAGGTGTGYKLGITDTGDAAAYNTVIQEVSASGSSPASRLLISGGWDLTGPSQTGYTYFTQTGTAYEGYGLRISSKSYLSIDKIGFLRYYAGLYVNTFDFLSINNALFTGSGNVFGIYAPTSTSRNLSVSNSGFVGFGQSAIYFTTQVADVIISTCQFKGVGHVFTASNALKVSFVGCDCNTQLDIFNCTYISGALMCNCTHDESTYTNVFKEGSWCGNGSRLVAIGEIESGGTARNRVYFYGGYTQDNTAEAEGGSGKCLQFNPKSATYWIEQDFNVPVTAATARTVAIKMKDDASFNGTVELELWYNGVCIVGPTTKTMTTSYVAQEMTATAGQIAADGVLVLKVKVYGTAGAVYADTLSYT